MKRFFILIIVIISFAFLAYSDCTGQDHVVVPKPPGNDEAYELSKKMMLNDIKAIKVSPTYKLTECKLEVVGDLVRCGWIYPQDTEDSRIRIENCETHGGTASIASGPPLDAVTEYY
jgi:hypothetical protein